MKAQEASLFFENNSSGYPSGTRPFKSSSSFAELDEPLKAALAAPVSLSLQIERGATRREAMLAIHRFCAKSLKSIDVEALENMVENRKAPADVASLRAIAEEVLTDASQEDRASALGLPKPLKAVIDPAAIAKKVDAIYEKVYKEINDKLEAEHKASQAQAALQEADAELVNTKPSELFESAVEKKVLDCLQAHSLIQTEESMGLESHSASAPQRFVDSVTLPKNEQSPSAEAGHNTVHPPKSRSSKGRGHSDHQQHEVAESPPSRVQSNSGKPWWQGIQRHAQAQLRNKYRDNPRADYGNGGKGGGRTGRGRGNAQQW